MYFKNLDGLRFLASMFVIIGHCQHILFDTHHIRVYSPFAEKLANFGVDFFFVLSGFLISFLLLKELKETESIDIKRFYFRRILRLWPLYFIVGIVGLLTAEPILRCFGMVDTSPTAIEWFANFAYLGLFSINFQILIGHMNPFSSPILGHFWSLSVEEQFYLLWAPALLFFRKKSILFILFMIAFGCYTTLYVTDFYKYLFPENFELAPFFFTSNRFFHFGLGALMAWVVLEKQIPVINKYLSIFLQLAFFLPMCEYLFGHHFYDAASERLINGFIAMAIIIVAIAKTSIFPFEIAWMKYLGKVSFGIYIFHLFAIRLTFKLLKMNNMEVDTVLFQVLLPVISAAIAIGLAVFSYEKIEKYFLSFRK
jgi:peptidoglycan/LPS O-acetylase OafA/YrhL